MTNKEILEKAIQKAISNGWYKEAIEHTFIGNSVHFQMSEISWELKSYNDIIFNHEFAKALWGEGGGGLAQGGTGELSWKHHLQDMVVSDDPIKYLGEKL